MILSVLYMVKGNEIIKLIAFFFKLNSYIIILLFSLYKTFMIQLFKAGIYDCLASVNTQKKKKKTDWIGNVLDQQMTDFKII